jgi:hypothetical protein
MPLVILHHLLNVFVQLANKRGFTKKNYIRRFAYVSTVIQPVCCLHSSLLMLATVETKYLFQKSKKVTLRPTDQFFYLLEIFLKAVAAQGL